MVQEKATVGEGGFLELKRFLAAPQEAVQRQVAAFVAALENEAPRPPVVEVELDELPVIRVDGAETPGGRQLANEHRQ